MKENKIYSLNDMILDNSYFKWLESIMQDKDVLMNVPGWSYKLTGEDEQKYNLTYDLVMKLAKFSFKFNKPIENLTKYYVKYNDNIYLFYYDEEVGYVCEKITLEENKYVIDYNEFRNFCKKNMKDNFNNLESRVISSLNNTDLDKINYELSKIVGPTLVSGVGGSSVVSEYASKILSSKNHIITRNTEPRDFKYIDNDLYKNVLACSYSGNGYAVELSFLNNLKHYLLASKESNQNNVINLNYNCPSNERSFISLAATLMPCSILLNYYLDGNKEKIIQSLNDYKFNFDTKCDIYEIFSGIDTSTASKYLESTMVESGIGVPIVHDKYSYCHGRSTLSTVNNNIAIYFNTDTELDKLLIQEIPKYYKDVIVLNTESNLYAEYELLVKCMYLTKYIAESKSKDLSGVDYNPIVKKLYRYKGNL